METIDETESSLKSGIQYPELMTRVKAMFFDSVILILFMISFTYVFDSIESVPDWARISAFIFIFLAYDPLFTSFFSGTIGHYAMGLRVRDSDNEKKRVIFPLAVIRYVLKVLLGWLSLMTVSSNAKGRAIHDLIASSVVISVKQANAK